MAWMAIVGAVISAKGQMDAADASARAGHAALVAAAITASRQRFESGQQAEAVRERSRREEGSIEADFAARGLAAGGSPAQLLLDKAYQDELTAQRIVYSGENAARDIMAKGRAGFSSSLDTAAGQRYGAAATLFKGAGDTYMQMRPGTSPNYSYGANGVSSSGVGQSTGGA